MQIYCECTSILQDLTQQIRLLLIQIEETESIRNNLIKQKQFLQSLCDPIKPKLIYTKRDTKQLKELKKLQQIVNVKSNIIDDLQKI
ncbi:hypothetical protein pb186bvf_010797 [Paramecium bursaria]